LKDKPRDQFDELDSESISASRFAFFNSKSFILKIWIFDPFGILNKIKKNSYKLNKNLIRTPEQK
jgi:hypothetical protein